MEERIWYELTQVKFNHRYCLLLLHRNQRIRNIFNIVTLAFSSAGILGWPIWNAIPLASCVIVSAISLIKLLAPHIIPSEKNIDTLEGIISFYLTQYNELEKLWLDFTNNRIDERKAQAVFFNLKRKELDRATTINSIVRFINRRLRSIAETDTKRYFCSAFVKEGETWLKPDTTYAEIMRRMPMRRVRACISPEDENPWQKRSKSNQYPELAAAPEASGEIPVDSFIFDFVKDNLTILEDELIFPKYSNSPLPRSMGK